MKRHSNLFEKIVEPDNIYQSYCKARKGKRWQDTVKSVEVDLSRNLEDIRLSLINKTFSTASYQVFVISEPKTRTIYKLPFNPDRIIQHALMGIIEPIWDKLFIYDSYSCRKGKGIHTGSRRTMEFIRQIGNQGYCLKMDISKFYPSINHNILYGIVQRKIKCQDTLWLLKNIIYSMDGGFNVPIGNYTSQWFGNLYMNELDQFLKYQHKVQHYIRYCDDFLVLHRDKSFLSELVNTIESYLDSRLGLKFSKRQVFPIKQGIDFLGYRHFPKYILLRKSTAKRVKKRLRKLPKRLEAGEISASQMLSSIASTKGWLRWCNTYNFERGLKLDSLKELCYSE